MFNHWLLCGKSLVSIEFLSPKAYNAAALLVSLLVDCYAYEQRPEWPMNWNTASLTWHYPNHAIFGKMFQQQIVLLSFVSFIFNHSDYVSNSGQFQCWFQFIHAQNVFNTLSSKFNSYTISFFCQQWLMLGILMIYDDKIMLTEHMYYLLCLLTSNLSLIHGTFKDLCVYYQ